MAFAPLRCGLRTIVIMHVQPSCPRFHNRAVPGVICMDSRIVAGIETCPRSVTFVTNVFMPDIIHHVGYHVKRVA